MIDFPYNIEKDHNKHNESLLVNTAWLSCETLHPNNDNALDWLWYIQIAYQYSKDVLWWSSAFQDIPPLEIFPTRPVFCKSKTMTKNFNTL